MQESQLYNLGIVSSNDIIELVLSWESYLLKERRYSKNTTENYIYDLIGFLQFKAMYDGEKINLEAIKNCDIKDIRSFLAERKMNVVRNSSNSRVLSGISSFFSYLVLKNVLSYNILLDIKRPKIEKKLPHPAVWPHGSHRHSTDFPGRW